MDLFKNNLGWFFTPDVENQLQAETEEEFFNNFAIFKTIIENIQDGVSVLDINFNIKYMNTTLRHMYSEIPEKIGNKCYEVFHERKTFCEDCPSLIAVKTKKPQTGVIKYYASEKHCHWHQIFTIPILNMDKEVMFVMEYVRDVTFQSSMIKNMNELAQKFEVLEKQNELLAELLVQRENSKIALEDTITSNVEKYIKPSLEYLKKTVDPDNIDLVNGLIDEIVYPITKKRNSAISTFTSREMQVAALIKEGYSSKEIAAKMFVTQKAVDFHRLNIRKKLNLGRNENLRTYLEIHL